MAVLPRVVFLLSLLCSANAQVAAQTPATAATPEYALKAAFMYNFALFTTWNERLDRTVHLCVLGRDPFGAALDQLQGKEIGTAHLTIQRLRNPSEAARNCQIIFVTFPEVENFLARPTAAQDSIGVLTISDRPGAARMGIIIELTMEDRKIGFEFNQEVARQNRLQVSSKLLRIARKVH